MRLEFLGHASLLLRSGDVALLFDPLLFGVHHQGLYDLYPPRELDVAAMPAIDAVVLSHAHRDHFDLESIARLDRRTPILAAADPDLLGCLAGLGFDQVQPLAVGVPFTAGDATITPTAAADGAIEHGFLIEEGGAAVWNLVDTFPSAATIAEVKRRVGAIDLLLAPWQPLQDATFPSGAPVVFPYDMYRVVLDNILQIAPRALVPGACGFRAIGPAAWTNHLSCPLTRDRVLADVAAAAPHLAGHLLVMEPGDALHVAPGVLARELGLLPYCRSDRAAYRWEELAYRPFDLGPPVVEPRGDAFTRDACLLDLRGERPELREGPSPLALAHTILPASLLIGLVAGTIAWDYALLSGELRQHDHTYRVDDAGLRLPHRRLVDPLAHLLGSPAAEEHHLALCVERLRAEIGDDAPIRPSEGERAPLIDGGAVMRQVLDALAAAGLDPGGVGR